MTFDASEPTPTVTISPGMMPTYTCPACDHIGSVSPGTDRTRCPNCDQYLDLDWPLPGWER